LRKEKQQRKELEGELATYKQLIAKSDNDKLIMMATKVELLNNQLNMAIERTNGLHKKTIKESGASGQESYLDELKRHIEKLEKQLSEMKAAETFKVKKHDESGGPQAMPTADEVSTNILCIYNVLIRLNTAVLFWQALSRIPAAYASKWRSWITHKR
jgi:hypothetical protein